MTLCHILPERRGWVNSTYTIHAAFLLDHLRPVYFRKQSHILLCPSRNLLRYVKYQTIFNGSFIYIQKLTPTTHGYTGCLRYINFYEITFMILKSLLVHHPCQYIIENFLNGLRNVSSTFLIKIFLLKY